MSSDVIEVECQCGRKVRAPKSKAGETGKCPYCRLPITIPALKEESESSFESLGSQKTQTKPTPASSGSAKGSLSTPSPKSDASAKISEKTPRPESSSWMGGQQQTAKRPIHPCPKCGKDNPKDATTCQHCHASFKSSSTPSAKTKTNGKKSILGFVVALFLMLILGVMIGIALGPEYFNVLPPKAKILQWLKFDKSTSPTSSQRSNSSNIPTNNNSSYTTSANTTYTPDNSSTSDPLPPPLMPVKPKLTQSRFLGDWYERLKVQLSDVDRLYTSSQPPTKIKFDTTGARIKLQTAYSISQVIQNNWPSDAQIMGDTLESNMSRKDVNLWIQKKQSSGDFQKANTLANFKSSKKFNPIPDAKLAELETAMQRLKNSGDIVREVDISGVLKSIQSIQRQYDEEHQDLNSAILSFETSD